jgi:hypothetical protein
MNETAKAALAKLSGSKKLETQWIEELREMRSVIHSAILRGAGMLQIHQALNKSGFKVPYRILSKFINKEIKRKKKGKGVLKTDKKQVHAEKKQERTEVKVTKKKA